MPIFVDAYIIRTNGHWLQYNGLQGIWEKKMNYVDILVPTHTCIESHLRLKEQIILPVFFFEKLTMLI